MNGSYDGGSGMYGLVQFDALAELGRLVKKSAQTRNGSQARSWKQVLMVLAICATPVVLLLAGGNGF